MSDSKDAQAARHEVDRQLREENRARYEELMRAAMTKRGLTWSPRLSPEERAERKAVAEKQKASAKIAALASAHGIGVLLMDDKETEQRIREGLQAAKDGTFQGTKFDWHGDQDGFADEAEAPAEA